MKIDLTDVGVEETHAARTVVRIIASETGEDDRQESDRRWSHKTRRYDQLIHVWRPNHLTLNWVWDRAAGEWSCRGAHIRGERLKKDGTVGLMRHGESFLLSHYEGESGEPQVRVYSWADDTPEYVRKAEATLRPQSYVGGLE